MQRVSSCCCTYPDLLRLPYYLNRTVDVESNVEYNIQVVGTGQGTEGKPLKCQMYWASAT
ncbi:hypothetical protein Plhal304r1_c023g0078541 [Plasmopara halstedii]